MKKNILFLFLLMSTGLFAQTYYEDFEGFNEGDYIGEVSENWTTWSGTTGTSEDAKIVTDKAKSGSKSIYFYSTGTSGGPQDVVLPFGNEYNAGVLNFEYEIFVSENSSAYMNIQGKSTIGVEWASNFYFYADGQMKVDAQSTMITSYNTNAWNKVQFTMDLTNKVWVIRVNGACVGTIKGSNSIASVDIFPIATGTDNSEFWIDDIGYTYNETTTELEKELTLVNVSAGAGISGTKKSISGTIYNGGSKDYTGNISIIGKSGNNEVTEDFGETTIEAGKEKTFEIEKLVEVANGFNAFSLVLDAEGDENACSNVVASGINGFTPAADKRVLVEEATGTWCQWCPRGAVYMDKMEETFGEYFVGVAVHNNDPMTDYTYDGWMKGILSANNGGYPSAVVDRDEVMDPATMENSVIKSLIEAPISFFDVQAQYNEESMEATLKVVVNAKEKILSSARVYMMLVEDGVTGTESGYSQANKYSGGGNGAMGGFENLPNPVPASQMVYNDVGRRLLPDAEGLKLDATIQPNNYKAFEFTTTIDPSWDLSKMKVVATLVTGLSKKTVDNTYEKTWQEALDSYVSNQEIQYTESINVFPNPSKGQTKIDIKLTETANVEIELYNAMGQLIVAKNFGKLSGHQILDMTRTNLDNGAYYLNIKTNNSFQTRKFIIQK